MSSAMRVDVQKINCLSGLIDGMQLEVLSLGTLEMLISVSCNLALMGATVRPR